MHKTIKIVYDTTINCTRRRRKFSLINLKVNTSHRALQRVIRTCTQRISVAMFTCNKALISSKIRLTF